MTNSRFKWVDIFSLIFGIVMLLGVATSPAPEKLEYVPDAVRGLTSLGGILVAFIGFCLTYVYSNIENREIKKWLQGRVYGVILLIGIGLLSIGGSYTDLVNGRLVASYKWIMIGFVIIVILWFNTTFLLLSLGEGKN